MQINPFGFPLGAGTQSAPNMGGTGLGFADALGLAAQGGAALAPVGLIASTKLPANFTARLSQTLLAQTKLDGQPLPATSALPGLQQPTSLSGLMATAAKLPAADPAPTVDPAPTADLATVSETATPNVQPEGPVETTPNPVAPQLPGATPAKPETGSVQPEATLPTGEALPEAPEATVPVGATPAKPQKGPRVRVSVEKAEPTEATAAPAAVPAEILAATVVLPQPVAQPQVAPREAAPQTGAGPVIKKVAPAGAPAADASSAASTAATPDFARAVAAKSESTGSEANADGQPQADPQLAAVATKPDVAAPVLPHATHGATATAPVPAAAPVAEPVIEARAGHLGHGLGVEIARKVELGEETLRIRLNPIELGRIEVTLAFDDKGGLQATVRTESAQAMDLLRQDAGDLARTLDQAGVRTDAQSFRFENRGGDSSGGQQAQQQQPQNRGRFASSDDDATIAEPVYRPVRSDGQVDLLA